MFPGAAPGSIHPGNRRALSPTGECGNNGGQPITASHNPSGRTTSECGTDNTCRQTVGTCAHGHIHRSHPTKVDVFILVLFMMMLLAPGHASSSNNTPSHQDATPPPREINVEDLILKHSINCGDIAVAATKLIPTLHGEEHTDTPGPDMPGVDTLGVETPGAETPGADTLRANIPGADIPGADMQGADTLGALLRYWRTQCGVTEPLMRYTVLTEIRAGTFHGSRLPALVLDYLDDYMDAAISDAETFSDYFFDFRHGDYVAMHPGFNDFTATLAAQLREISNLRPTELFFADFYANDFEDALLRLESGQLEGTMLDSLYRADNPLRETQVAMRARRRLPLPGDGFPEGTETPESDPRDHQDRGDIQDPDDPRHAGDTSDPGMRQVRPRNRPGVHWGGTLGWWSPMGKLRTMGNHPQAGFITGGTISDFLFGFQMKIGFLNTPIHYEAVVDGELYETRNFTQVFLGIHGGINVFSDPVNAFYITGGAGYDGIDPLKHSHRQEDSTDVSHMINSLNLNTGLTYKRIINERRFFSVMMRYNFLDYRNRGGSDLSGNAVTVGFAYGIHERW